MKRYFYLLLLMLFGWSAAFAQDDPGDGNDPSVMREKLTEYVQKRLNMSKAEAEKFTPVFIRYFAELRQTHMDNRNDRLVLQQKIADLRVKYREQFRPIIGEARANRVFGVEREFVQKVKAELQMRQRENLDNRRTPIRN